MTLNEDREKWEPIFSDAVRKVAPSSAKIYSKLIIGLQAQADLAVREREEMAAELATLKQRKMAVGKFITSDFWWGVMCAVMMCGVGTLAVTLLIFVRG